ncbi:MAG: TIGR03032 family protein [Thermoguttaceae bacterium]|nr:TIGR03032 family protein [Thermoguttaceae bacterium]MDW8080124.1 TIGR03032 family protein [Thermoguttaceae bacterium]
MNELPTNGHPTANLRPDSFACRVDDGFVSWLAASGGSLALTTYQAGKVALVGWDGQQVTLLLRHFDKPLGLALEGNRLALACRNDVVVFANAPALASDYLENQPGRYDALFLPRISFHTGELSSHDVAFVDGSIVVVNTKFSCLARLSWEYTFEPIWQPPFISDIVPEDRCHLNGLALVDGKPGFVTAHAATDQAEGWRSQRLGGGVVVDIRANRVCLSGLCMPHSPRWDGARLWFLNSGTGELMVWSPGGTCHVVCRLPGYVRGLCLVGRYALVGLSKIREKYLFGGLPIESAYSHLMCGVAVVDICSGQWVGTFEFTGGCTELYDVQFLPGMRRPMIVNLEKPACREAFTTPECSFWIRRTGAGSGAGPGQIISAACGMAGQMSVEALGR